MLRRPLLFAVLALVALTGAVRAESPAVFATGGAAIRGYDPVAYFTQHKPVRGSVVHRVMWRGATWYFVSARNRERFESNPRAYAPKYGGYCAYSVAQGTPSASDPLVWRIENGRLYLLQDRAALALWLADRADYVVRADRNWPAVLKR